MSRTPLTLPTFPGPPRCAQCAKVFGKAQPRYRNVWGEVCQACHEAGATLLQPSTSAPRYQPLGKAKVHLDLTQGANVFEVITAVTTALHGTGQRELARAWTQEALDCHHLEEVLALARTYVDLTTEEPS